MAIDTLKVARRLREAGFNEAQAEVLVAAVREGAEGADLATKADLTVQSVELRAEIAAQGAELRAEIAAQGAELRAEIAALRSELREMEQRLIARIESVKSASEAGLESVKSGSEAGIASLKTAIEASKSEMLGRMFQMILGAVLVNFVAMLGVMFAFAKLLGH